MNSLYEQMATSVFERMSLAAASFGAVNLGQGFPDFGWPDEILDAAAQALKQSSNQYAPSRGLPALREAVAAHYNRHFGQALTQEHVCVTSGATEALGAAILATVQPGDEVIIFSPAYDSYAPMIRRAGGMPVEVPLKPPAWLIDQEMLRTTLSRKTRAILLNNPHNPTGRLFAAEELEAIASVARERDLIVISDEVWEHVVLGPPPNGDAHRDRGLVPGEALEGSPSVSSFGAATSPCRRGFIPIATLPDMAGRTIKIGSAGKIFSLTGWKVGWMVAAPELTSVLARAHQFLTFSTPPNLQAAVAFGLNDGDRWLGPMRARFERSRDRLAAGLRGVGYSVLDAASTYFLCVGLQASGIAIEDSAFADAAVEHAGVAVIPLSAFAECNPPRNFVRLCFGKKDETIDAGIAAMARARELLA